ncbi:MAG TPA: ribbon-helix-helix domain-containing protein [Thermoplasmata archaeon]
MKWVGRLDEGSEKITLRVPRRFLRMVDFLVEVDDFPSRSEAIRTAIRDIVYQRVQTVQDRLKRMEDAEKALADFEELKRRFMQS